MTKLPNPFPRFKPAHITSKVASDIKVPKAGTNGSLVVLIADASGSMSNFLSDTIGGCNAFIDAQKNDDIPTKVMFVTFESNSVNKVFDKVNLKNIPTITNSHYQIGGSTNLLDAIGKTFNEVASYLKRKKKADRPSVVFQIITDGQENSSRMFNYNTIKSMIEKAQEKNWVFSFVGANIDSFSVASSLGIYAGGVSNYSQYSTKETFATMGASLAVARESLSRGLSAESVSSSYYTEDDRMKMVKGK